MSRIHSRTNISTQRGDPPHNNSRREISLKMWSLFTFLSLNMFPLLNWQGPILKLFTHNRLQWSNRVFCVIQKLSKIITYTWFEILTSLACLPWCVAQKVFNANGERWSACDQWKGSLWRETSWPHSLRAWEAVRMFCSFFFPDRMGL